MAMFVLILALFRLVEGSESLKGGFRVEGERRGGGHYLKSFCNRLSNGIMQSIVLKKSS